MSLQWEPWCQSTERSSSPKDRLQSRQVHVTMSQTYACIQHTVIHHTKMNLSTVKWAQWDKTTSRELLGLFICVCIHCAQLLHTILHRTDLIIFPLTLQRITIAPMMSIWGKGDRPKASHVTWEVQIFHGKGQFWWIGAPIVKYRHFLP